MRTFRFRLDRLIEIRRYREREWELKLADATGRCILIRQKMGGKQAEAGRAIKSRFHQIGTMDTNFLATCELYLTRLDSEIDALEQDLALGEAKRQEVQQGYLDASRERKVMEKLRERRQDEYRQEQKKEEFRQLNEINTGSLFRRRSY